MRRRPRQKNHLRTPVDETHAARFNTALAGAEPLTQGLHPPDHRSIVTLSVTARYMAR